jgi:hypothetical protein
VIAQVIIHVGHAHVEHHTAKQLLAVCLWLTAIALQYFGDFRVARAVSITQAE